MAAILESLLNKKVELSDTLRWLQGREEYESQTSGLNVSKEEFVAFLLNFLRDQSCHTLTHGPSTPAKTPSASRSVRVQGSADRRSSKSTPVHGPRSTSRVQLFSPTQSMSPVGRRSGLETPITDSNCLSGVSVISSPSFSSISSPAPRNSPCERRSAQRPSLGDFMTSPNEIQSSPSLQPHRGRRRSGGLGRGTPRQLGAYNALPEDGGSWEGGKRSRAVAKVEQVPLPPQGNLNLYNLEDFPPVSGVVSSPGVTKPSRRINPTPVSTERPNSKPKSCFTSPPASQAANAVAGELIPFENISSPHSLQEERELLKQERSKFAHQTSTPLKTTSSICTPTKSADKQGSNVTPDHQLPCPEVEKVTQSAELDLLAKLYCACISDNLVPCVFLELFFVLQLLTSRGVSVSDVTRVSVCDDSVLEKNYLGSVHNCVYFSVKVLENQIELVSHLDKCTLRLLSENERLGAFSPYFRDRLAQAQDSSTAEVLPHPPLFIHSVAFQPATDNRSNFSSDRAFHTFKKQRDVFYGLLREWEDSHKEPDWDFEAALGSRVRVMVSQLSAAGSHSHFARLFQKQLIQICKGPCQLYTSSDAPDADLLGMLGAESLGRLKRLQQRLVQPQGLIGPCPPPSFPGHQEFFRDFLQTASCCQLNQHLKDGLCQQLLQLDEESILGPDASPSREEGTEDGDLEQQDEKQRFSSVLLTARLLAKFLGFISFLPYQTFEAPSRDIQEAAIALRCKSCPVLDVCAVLRSSVLRKRTILTVPWVVEFLSMLDYTGAFLPCYRNALCLLLQLYKGTVLSRGGELCYMNHLLIVAVLGWLFQIPIFPEDLFFNSDVNVESQDMENNMNTQGLDTLPLVDKQLLYTCCPYLGEFRKLLAAFVAGSTSKSGGLIRKITPTSAEPKASSITCKQQKLQVDLEQAFFHNQPPSLRRTVEFVAERVGSNCVKHIKAAFVLEIVKGGVKTLTDGLSLDGVNLAKLNDSVCRQLCDTGMQALERATRFCNENAPGAVRVLLPLETSPAVLTTAQNITTRLSTEKACSWLSSNISTLIKREWKTAFERTMKTMPSSNPDTEGTSTSPSGFSAGSICVTGCTHKVPLGSDVLIEIKEVLSVAVGPRSDEEVFTIFQIESLLDRVGQTLGCRKFLSPVVEQMLLRCSVQLACTLVSRELPLVSSTEGKNRSSLLERFVLLWCQTSSPPLHLLLSDLTLSAIFRSPESEWTSYLYLIKKLTEKGLLGEEEVSTIWPKLSSLFPEESMKKFQKLSLVDFFPNHMTMLQVSQ